jgi:hypothetical protein
VADEDFLISYDAPCPKCGRTMIEPFTGEPRREDGIIVVRCSVHGLFHFRPDRPEAGLLAGEPEGES